MRRAFITAFILVAVLAASARARAQEGSDVRKSSLYQWTDDQGGVHITDQLGEVPDKFRAKARVIEGSQKSRTSQEPGIQMNAEPLITPQNEEDTDEARKALWQNRIHEWKTRLADAERRYRELDQQRTELLMSWGGPAYGPM